jgi:Family of unknown function (DUF6932)
MLPPFDEHGNLPPGIHRASVEEVADRFGTGSEEREVEIKELSRFIEAARSVGAKRLIINGSFVTDKVAPNDVDIVVLPGDRYPTDPPVFEEEETRWPFLHVHVAADQQDLQDWINRDFGFDRDNHLKGVVEIIL